MIELIHRGCGRVAFLHHYRLAPGEVVMAANVELLDGSTPHPGAPMICGSCGQWLSSPDELANSPAPR